MSIMITGGAGFIGSSIADGLIKEGYEVIIVDNQIKQRKQNINSKAKKNDVDVCSSQLSECFDSDVEAVIHNAALIKANESFLKTEEYFRNNVLGTLNVLECCKNFNVKKFIFASSGGAIYGEQKKFPCDELHEEKPINPYGMTKLMAEKLILNFKKKYRMSNVILRYSNVYGPRQTEGAASIFIKSIKNKKTIFINGDGNQTRDFVFVEDVVDLNIKALKSKNNGIFNVSSETETSVNDIIEHLKKISKKYFKVEYRKIAAKEVLRSCLKNEKAKKAFNWHPKHSMEEGLRKTFEFWKNEN